MSCSAAKKPCSSTKISLTDMAPAAQQEASAASVAAEKRFRDHQRSQSQRPPPPPRPLGPTLRTSLGSSEVRGAQPAGLSSVLPDVSPAASGADACVQGAGRKEVGGASIWGYFGRASPETAQGVGRRVPRGTWA